MKLNQKKTSTQPRIFSYPIDNGNSHIYAVAPNPPSPEAIKRAQFVDKTYVWKEK